MEFVIALVTILWMILGFILAMHLEVIIGTPTLSKRAVQCLVGGPVFWIIVGGALTIKHIIGLTDKYVGPWWKS